jgi:hypothetical protein
MRNRARHFENDGFTSPHRDPPMTLTYALISQGAIVLAADSQRTTRHEVADSHDSRLVAVYKDSTSKIRELPNGAAFSVAGNSVFVDHLLLTAAKGKQSPELDGSRGFISMTVEYSRIFGKEFDRIYPDESQVRPECDFLFCGFEEQNERKILCIVKLSCRLGFSWNIVATEKGYGFSGRAEHGGVLYLHHRFYYPELTKDAGQFLAYCILAEVAESDNMVSGPIEMAIVTEHGVKPFTDFQRYERKRQNIVSAVRSLVRSDP